MKDLAHRARYLYHSLPYWYEFFARFGIRTERGLYLSRACIFISRMRLSIPLCINYSLRWFLSFRFWWNDEDAVVNTPGCYRSDHKTVGTSRPARRILITISISARQLGIYYRGVRIFGIEIVAVSVEVSIDRKIFMMQLPRNTHLSVTARVRIIVR